MVRVGKYTSIPRFPPFLTHTFCLQKYMLIRKERKEECCVLSSSTASNIQGFPESVTYSFYFGWLASLRGGVAIKFTINHSFKALHYFLRHSTYEEVLEVSRKMQWLSTWRSWMSSTCRTNTPTPQSSLIAQIKSKASCSVWSDFSLNLCLAQ